MAVAPVEPQAGNRLHRSHGVPWAFKENKLDQRRQFLNVLPEVKLWQLVATNNPVKLVVREEPPKMLHQIDRKAKPASLTLEIRNFKAVVPFNGRPQHREAICRR